MLLSVSVCLFVCLLTGYSKTTDQTFIKFYGMAGHNPGTNRLDFGNPNWSKVTTGQKRSKLFSEQLR